LRRFTKALIRAARIGDCWLRGCIDEIATGERAARLLEAAAVARSPRFSATKPKLSNTLLTKSVGSG